MIPKYFEVCYIIRKHGKSYIRSGVYNLQKEDAELALARARMISTKYYFLREHPARPKISQIEVGKHLENVDVKY